MPLMLCMIVYTLCITQADLTMWQPSVCLNFLDELLVWIRKNVVQDDLRYVF